MPNQTYEYVWKVLPRAGPGPADGNSIVWGYHSHVSESDVYMGLYGAILIYRPGTLSYDEVVSSFFSESQYFEKTLTKFEQNTQDNQQMKSKSHIYSVINGLINSSPPDLIFRKKKVVWHLVAWGTFWDTHHIKWSHGDITFHNKKVNQIRLYPASFYTVTLTFKTSGQYKFGNLDNEGAGMVMYYNVSLS
ncbi:hypothetical protein BY458DRAFT_523818 [Sporodiniella umbellata]|nr:hypothetical protein BY458DRAFT_523818 [Sporodiniella umbellata]